MLWRLVIVCSNPGIALKIHRQQVFEQSPLPVPILFLSRTAPELPDGDIACAICQRGKPTLPNCLDRVSNLDCLEALLKPLKLRLIKAASGGEALKFLLRTSAR